MIPSSQNPLSTRVRCHINRSTSLFTKRQLCPLIGIVQLAYNQDQKQDKGKGRGSLLLTYH
jgi:hypothetical protein